MCQFEIKVIDPDVTAGTIPVTWCLNPEEGTTLSPDTAIVIIVAPTENYHISKETRSVVLVRDLVTYLPFKVPGACKIWAFISESSFQVAKDMYLCKSKDVFLSHILNNDGDGWGFRFDVNPDKQPKFSSTQDIYIPNSAFAKPAPEWEQNWVNLFFQNQCVDQCHYRKRRIFAYTIQPCLMFGSLLIRFLVTLAALLFGSRAFTLKYLLHPIQTDLPELKELYEDGTVFVRRVGWIDADSPDFEHVKHFLKQYWSLPLMPPILAFLVMLVVIPGLAYNLGVILLVALALAIAVAIVVGFADGESRARIFDWFNTLFTKVDASALTEEEIELLRCQPDKEITLATLPAHKKSIKLRFMATKSKICKPFAA